MCVERERVGGVYSSLSLSSQPPLPLPSFLLNFSWPADRSEVKAMVAVAAAPAPRPPHRGRGPS